MTSQVVLPLKTSVLFIEDACLPEKFRESFLAHESPTLIALNVRAAYELERRGIPCRNPEDLYSRDAYEKLGLSNYRNVEELTRWLDNTLKTHVEIVRKEDLSPATAHYFELKLLIDSVMFALLKIDGVLGTIKPRKIYMMTYRTPGHKPRGIPPTNEESLYGRLIPLVAEHLSIPVEELDRPPSASPLSNSSKEKSSVTAYLRSGAFPGLQLAMTICSLIKHFILPHLKPWLINSFTKDPKQAIVSPLLCYDVPPVLRLAIREGSARVYHFDPETGWITRLFPFLRFRRARSPDPRTLSLAKRQLDAAWEDIRLQAPSKECFQWRGMNIFPVVEDRFSLLIKELIAKDIESYGRSLSTLEDHKKRHPATTLIAASPPQSGIAMAYCAARRCGFRTFKYQHGADGYFHYPMLPYSYLTNTDCWLTYGEGVRKIAEHAKKHPVRIVAVGSSVMDDLKAAQREQTKPPDKGSRFRAVYVITNMGWNRRYVAYHMYEDPTYFSVQRAIIDAFKKHPEVDLVLKTHPNLSYPESPVVDYIRDQKMSNCTVVRTGAFVDLIESTDMIVIDSPTTTLLQSLTTVKQIFVYNGILRIAHDAVEQLKKRCTYSENLNQFLITLNAALTEKKKGAPSLNTEFLQAYGTHWDDGLSAQRALREILCSED